MSTEQGELTTLGAQQSPRERGLSAETQREVGISQTKEIGKRGFPQR